MRTGAVDWTSRTTVQTGEIFGVLGDGSGGDTSKARIQEPLKRPSRAITIVNLLSLAAGEAGLVSGPGELALGAVAAYGQVLARLYEQVDLATTAMDASAVDRQIGLAALSLACNLATDLDMFRLGDNISGWIENIFGSMGGPSVCLGLAAAISAEPGRHPEPKSDPACLQMPNSHRQHYSSDEIVVS